MPNNYICPVHTKDYFYLLFKQLFMEEDIFKYQRKSYIGTVEIYFWTATLNKWQFLLKEDIYKEIIIGSLDFLSKRGKLDIFAFVIMPNHIHLILRANEKNGRETAQGSFLKFTAHEFKKELRKHNPAMLADYSVKALNKEHEFWQRDPLAIHLPKKLRCKSFLICITTRWPSIGIWPKSLVIINIHRQGITSGMRKNSHFSRI